MLDLSRLGNDVICYGSQNQFNFIKNTNISCREYILFDKANLKKYPYVMNPYLENSFKTIYERVVLNKFHLNNVYKQIKEEDPDIIIYDEWLSILGYFIENELNIRSFCSVTKMAFCKDIATKYSEDMCQCLGIPTKEIINYGDLLGELDDNVRELANSYAIPYERTEYYIGGSGKNNIVFNYSLFQPFYEKFDIDYHFVGSSFENFCVKRDDWKKRIDIYVSLGTVNNNNAELINLIIRNDTKYDIIQ